MKKFEVNNHKIEPPRFFGYADKSNILSISLVIVSVVYLTYLLVLPLTVSKDPYLSSISVYGPTTTCLMSSLILSSCFPSVTVKERLLVMSSSKVELYFRNFSLIAVFSLSLNLPVIWVGILASESTCSRVQSSIYCSYASLSILLYSSASSRRLSSKSL